MKKLTKQNTANFEAALRRKARLGGLLLRKCRSRDPQHPAFGTYGLADTSNNSVLNDGSTGYGVSLEAVASYLKT